MTDVSSYAWAHDTMAAIVRNVEQVVYGKSMAVNLVVATLAAEGHVLLEDVPGTGKTSLASALASSVRCYFRRIQFTPDVMPSDISGFSIYNQKTNDFEFRPGAVMANIVLADEINRASPKTQSALLEAMEEAQVTVDGETHTLAQPFFVIATQNPIEQYGTYPLPEAQVDRFMCQLSIGYPTRESELQILRRDADAKASLRPVTTALDVLKLREVARTVHACATTCAPTSSTSSRGRAPRPTSRSVPRRAAAWRPSRSPAPGRCSRDAATWSPMTSRNSLPTRCATASSLRRGACQRKKTKDDVFDDLLREHPYHLALSR